MIKIIRNHLFQITFENGATVSIHIGGGSYSDNHDNFGLIGHERESEKLQSANAEIAAWKLGGQWITEELRQDATDDVLGWQTPAQILEFLNKAANYEGQNG